MPYCGSVEERAFGIAFAVGIGGEDSIDDAVEPSRSSPSVRLSASQKSSALSIEGAIVSVPAVHIWPSEARKADSNSVHHAFNRIGRRREWVARAGVHGEGLCHGGFLRGGSFGIRSVYNGWTWRDARIWARGSVRNGRDRDGLRLGVHCGACTVVGCGELMR